MTGPMKTSPFAEIAAAGRITPGDVLALRRGVFHDGIVGVAEAESLFALDAACSEKCAEWTVFFCEALTDFLVFQERPAGHVSEDQADWLIRMVDRDGAVETATEFELILCILEKAKSSPPRLAAYALEQLVPAILEGKGCLRAADGAPAGAIGKAEVDLVRRILYAFGGDGNIAVTRAEAEVLFHLNEATEAARNHPDWNDLFVKAVANYVLCGATYEPPTRQQALAREEFLDAAEPGIGSFFARMAAAGFSGLTAYAPSRTMEADWEARNHATEAMARKAESVDVDEARWLADRIGNDRELQENEKALLAFIRSASPSIHPDLLPLMQKVA